MRFELMLKDLKSSVLTPTPYEFNCLIYIYCVFNMKYSKQYNIDISNRRLTTES